MTCPSWVAPRAWLNFIELDKAVVLVWLDWLVFCEYVFSVSALWCPLATPTILLGFLLPWAWGVSSWLLQQSAAAAPYLGRGVSPHCHTSWPSTWDSSSRPSCARAASSLDVGLVLPAATPGVGRGVAPPGRRPWPRPWGHGVAPPGCRLWPWPWGRGVAPPGGRSWPQTRGNSSRCHLWPRTRGSSSLPHPPPTSDAG